MESIVNGNRGASFLRASSLALVLLSSINCAGISPRVTPDPSVEIPVTASRSADDAIYVQYLGTGGNLIWRGEHGLLTAPLYSNPGLFRVGFWRIAPDTTLINRLQPHPPGVEIEAILVGHAHYDHLLDVPYIAQRHLPETAIYGNASVGRIVVATDSALVPRMIVLDDELSRNNTPGAWLYLADSTIRFMAVESDHGPHLFGIHVMRGEVKQDLQAVPRRAWAWREGVTFAYLIDFLNPDGSIDFRIHYQDATSHYPLGSPPDLAQSDSHRVDLLFVCVGGWSEVPDYPGAVLRDHQPRHVILGHWENFFRSPLKPPRGILRVTRLRLLAPRMERELPPDADWLVPLPGAVYRYFPAGS